jgi:hypothetical protein
MLTFSDFLSLYENINNPIIDRDLSQERDELMKQVVELVGIASESGLTIQITDVVTNLGKVKVKIIINGIENIVELEDNLMKISSPDGGLLDGVKGDCGKIIDVLQGVRTGNLSEI